MSADPKQIPSSDSSKETNTLATLQKLNIRIESVIAEFNDFNEKNSEVLASADSITYKDEVYNLRANSISTDEKRLGEVTTSIKDLKDKFPNIDKKINSNLNNPEFTVAQIKYNQLLTRQEILLNDIKRNKDLNAAVDRILAAKEQAKSVKEQEKTLQEKLDKLRIEAEDLSRKLKDTPEAQTAAGKAALEFH